MRCLAVSTAAPAATSPGAGGALAHAAMMESAENGSRRARRGMHAETRSTRRRIGVRPECVGDLEAAGACAEARVSNAAARRRGLTGLHRASRQCTVRRGHGPLGIERCGVASQRRRRTRGGPLGLGGPADSNEGVSDMDERPGEGQGRGGFQAGGGARSRVGLILGPVLFASRRLLPAPAAMTPAAWRAAATGILMAVWWITEAIPIPATALLPLLLFPLLGVAPIGAAAAPYANPVIF